MKKGVYHIIKSIAGFVLLFNIISLAWVVIYAYVPIPVTKIMLVEGKEEKVKYDWVRLEKISGKVQLAVMCAEDQFFLLHNGLDFDSIDKAMVSNKSGGTVRGASTLTQQVAKNVFLWPNRDWARKAAELYFTLLIEVVWSKERIMEVYLNVAEFGDGIFGVEAAAQEYFGIAASDLTTRQAAQLAAVLPSPKRFSVTNPSSYVQGRVKWIRKQMKHWGYKMTYDESFVEKMIK